MNQYTTVSGAEIGKMKVSVCSLILLQLCDKDKNGYFFNTGYQKIYHPYTRILYDFYNNRVSENTFEIQIIKMVYKKLKTTEITKMLYEFYEPVMLQIITSDIIEFGEPLKYEITDIFNIEFGEFNICKVETNNIPTKRKQFLKDKVNCDINIKIPDKPEEEFNIECIIKEYVTNEGIWVAMKYSTVMENGFLLFNITTELLYQTCVSRIIYNKEEDHRIFINLIFNTILEKYENLINQISKEGTSNITYHRVNSKHQQKDVYIGYTLRNMPEGWKHSEEAELLAEHLGITLEDNQTIVSEHIRHYGQEKLI